MVRNLECRIMQNHPGTGWYWEVVESREVVARGLAETHREAVSQAAEVGTSSAERAATAERVGRPQSFLEPSRPSLITSVRPA
jgi:hypothetical protein